MTAQALNTVDEKERIEDIDETPGTDGLPSKLLQGCGRQTPKKIRDGLPVVIWTAFFRCVVLIGDYLLAITTAMVVIPMLGAWLHQQSGAAQGSLSAAGTIAMWLMPLLFLVILLAAGEIAVMRAMWRWGTRMIQKVRDGHAEEPGTASAPSPRPATRTNHRSRKNNQKGST